MRLSAIRDQNSVRIRLDDVALKEWPGQWQQPATRPYIAKELTVNPGGHPNPKMMVNALKQCMNPGVCSGPRGVPQASCSLSGPRIHDRMKRQPARLIAGSFWMRKITAGRWPNRDTTP
jgi:hypothetical protein